MGIEQQPLDQDAIIWLGDYNYRINGSAGAITHAMSRNMYEVLLNNDQLAFEHKVGHIGWGFKEGIIEFAPTYKLTKNEDSYNISERLPGWTDRILYYTAKDIEGKEILVQKSYDSNNLLKISDHRPVFSQFELRFEFNEGDSMSNGIQKQLSLAHEIIEGRSV